MPQEDYFQAPFAIWLQKGAGRRGRACQGIQTHELLRALGVGWEQRQALQAAPKEEVWQRAWCLPGKHGLATVLQSLWTAEQEEVAEEKAATGTTALVENFKEGEVLLTSA